MPHEHIRLFVPEFLFALGIIFSLSEGKNAFCVIKCNEQKVGLGPTTVLEPGDFSFVPLRGPFGQARLMHSISFLFFI